MAMLLKLSGALESPSGLFKNSLSDWALGRTWVSASLKSLQVLWLLMVLSWVAKCCAAFSHFSLVQLFATPWTIAHQGPLSMGFFRQKYWSGLWCLLPGNIPDQELNLCLLHCRCILYHWVPGEIPEKQCSIAKSHTDLTARGPTAALGEDSSWRHQVWTSRWASLYL